MLYIQQYGFDIFDRREIGMPVQIILPTSMVIALGTYGMIARWYVVPRMRRARWKSAMAPLLLFHAFRFIGLAFLIPGVTNGALDSRFAGPAAYGDLLAALLALVSVLALKSEWRSATALIWIFSVEGTVDLVNAVVRGLLYTEDGQLGATYFIPAVIVPALLVSHLLIFQLLLTRKRSSES